MADIGSLITNIDEAFSREGTICLWFSGGKDSRLILEVMLRKRRPFGILLFQDGWTKEQRQVAGRVIVDNNLQAFSYPAVNHLLVAENGELSLISIYPIDGRGNVSTIIRDFVDGERCLFDVKLPSPEMLVAPTEYDNHILGTRQDDRHWIFEDRPLGLGPQWEVGAKTFLAPLWKWTASDVQAACAEVGIENVEPDTGNLHCCSKCLTQAEPFCPKVKAQIEPHRWDAKTNLEIGRKLLIKEDLEC